MSVPGGPAWVSGDQGSGIRTIVRGGLNKPGFPGGRLPHDQPRRDGRMGEARAVHNRLPHV